MNGLEWIAGTIFQVVSICSCQEFMVIFLSWFGYCAITNLSLAAMMFLLFLYWMSDLNNSCFYLFHLISNGRSIGVFRVWCKTMWMMVGLWPLAYSCKRSGSSVVMSTSLWVHVSLNFDGKLETKILMPL